MTSLLALGYSMLMPQETEEKGGADTPAVDDNTSKSDAHAHTPVPDPDPPASTKSLPHPPSSFKGLPKPPNGEASGKLSRRPSFLRSSSKADVDSESTRKGSSKESKRHKVHASPKDLDDQYAKQMAKVAKLMRKMARAEQREKNARWKAAMQDITLAREAGIDPQKEKVGWDEDSEDEAAPASNDNTLKKPVTDLSAKSTDADAPPPESGDTLARFIHAMFSSVNPFEEAQVESKGDDTEPAAADSQSAETESKSASKDPKDTQADPEVLRLLSSASTMNQSSQSRRSVWSVLDRLTPGRAKKSGASEEGSIMLSAPLFATEDSKVTVAQSEMKTVEEHESDTEDAKPNSSKFASLVTRMGVDGMFGKKKKDKEDSEAEKVDESEAAVEVIVEPEQPKTKEVRVWRPSADGISLQCSWWGYRIYLPPAVIAVLNDQKLEAANRAAIVTTALQWIIDHIPTAAFPPQVGLVISLVRGIIPAMGYIGGFVAWSWNTIVGFDQGDGVVLSATWLLPIALIPSAWDIEPVGMPMKAIEDAHTPEPTPEPVPEPVPEPKSELKSKLFKSKPQPQPQPQPEPLPEVGGGQGHQIEPLSIWING
ncbi:HIT domain protein [Rhizoctonia solani AG-3 Rhs1AP]|uniref:HIT domain protein n=1 Tax=Rhizoctonia solani AG-3 Rhs1AP TaxID=1086054 RepID=X8JTH6_9AGAM|nr:HIT domain protein [Rhizoctonia solani AG-3 Rhs1AP]